MAKQQQGKLKPGHDAALTHGWLSAHKWLLLRRLSQLSILFLFLIGPWFGIWLVKGNLASSLTLETLPLSDPYVLLQSIFAGQWPVFAGLLGAIIVTAFYLLVGGRVYCAWVCPINIITDAAAWLRRRLGIKGGLRFAQATRYWLLGLTFVLAFITGSIVWELVNPVSMVFRGLVFGMGLAWGLILAIFLLDFAVSRRAWCGALCPVGAFYSLLDKPGLIRVSASKREDCNQCLDCFVVCPEAKIISSPLKDADKGVSPVITSNQCTRCGRCIDVCSKDVFRFEKH